MCEFLFAAKKNSLYVKKEEDSEGIKSCLSKFCAVFFSFFLSFYSHGLLFRPFDKALSTNHVQVSNTRQLAFFRCNQMLA